MRIFERLRLICEEKAINIKDFAEITGMPYRTAQSYLSGDREPNADGMKIICTQLRVNINWLLTGEGEHFIVDGDSMDSNEQSLLFIYRDMNDVGKRVALRTMTSFGNAPELKDPNLNIQPLTQI